MARYTHDAVLTFDYPSSARARVVAESVRREVDEIGSERSRARVARDDATLTVTVEAADLTALRAGCNTWTTLVDVAEHAAELGDRFSQR
jgi:KEOPS complex subunit Pcc1